MKGFGLAGSIGTLTKKRARSPQKVRSLLSFALNSSDLSRVEKSVRIFFQVTRRNAVGKISERYERAGAKKFVAVLGNQPRRLVKFLGVKQERKGPFPTPLIKKDPSYPRPLKPHALFADLGPQPAKQKIVKQRMKPVFLVRCTVAGNSEKDILLRRERAATQSNADQEKQGYTCRETANQAARPIAAAFD
jgi:hypothetical protein